MPSCVLPLTEENVEKVLDEVRPGLMADGGNVALHEIDGLVVVLKLQGACGSCPSSTMTLKMGIETRLRDKIPEIEAVEQILDTETGLELNEENVEKVSQLNISSFLLLVSCMKAKCNQLQNIFLNKIRKPLRKMNSMSTKPFEVRRFSNLINRTNTCINFCLIGSLFYYHCGAVKCLETEKAKVLEK